MEAKGWLRSDSFCPAYMIYNAYKDTLCTDKWAINHRLTRIPYSADRPSELQTTSDYRLAR